MDKFKIIENSQLSELLSSPRKLNFALDFALFSEEENKMWEEKLKKYYYSCGCETGGLFMISSLFLSIIIIIFEVIINNRIIPFIYYLYLVLIIVLMSLIGKFVGKLIAQIKFKINLKRLEKRIIDLYCAIPNS